MDHMHISGTEPLSVILSQNNAVLKVEKWCPKVLKQTEVKRDGVVNPQNYNFNKF